MRPPTSQSADDSERLGAESKCGVPSSSQSSLTRNLLLFGVMLLLGFGLGMVSLMLIQHVGAQVRFHSLMALVAAMAALLILAAIMVAAVKWLWRSRGAALFSRLWQAISIMFSKPPGMPWGEHAVITWREHGPLLWGAVLTTLAFWAGLGLLHPIVGGLFSFASYLSSQANVEVMDSQNRIVALDQEFQQANAYAERRFQQIATILLNIDSSTAEQLFALQELPDAMRISVPRAVYDPKIPGGVRRIISLPNLEGLRSVLRQYMRMDRVTHILKKEQIPFKVGEPLDAAAMKVLASQEAISNELLRTLHRLGPKAAGEQKPSECLWTLTMKIDAFEATPSNGVIELEDPSQIPSLRQVRREDNEGKRVCLDLSHLVDNDLEELCVPYAFHKGSEFFRGQEESFDEQSSSDTVLSMRGAQLQGANLSYFSLRGGDLRDTQLQNASGGREVVNLEGADLSFAILFRANLDNANLRGADLTFANLQSAKLRHAMLNGACLDSAEMNGADLSYSILHGADLLTVDLRCANLMEAKMHGVNLTQANLLGASLEKAELPGVLLEGAKLHAANLSGTKLGAGKFAFQKKEIASSLRYAFYFKEESGDDLSHVLLPAAVMPEDLRSVEAVFVRNVSANELVTKLSNQSLPDCFSIDEEPLSEQLLWLGELSEKYLERYPWPPEMEGVMQAAFGKDRVIREVRPIIIEFTCFHSPEGGAWMTADARDSLVKSLDSDYYRSRAGVHPEKRAENIQEARGSLEKVESPHRYDSLDAWESKLREVMNAREELLRQLGPPPPPPPQP